ncbi:hypothetical protein TNCV_2535961 [Trichonephila clavipes]|nr:hypothetical protein TNCV_2535961 [Trichonephila clavipes]
MMAVVHVRRYAGERCLPECVIERNSGLTTGVMVWDAISYHGRSNLLRLRGRLKAKANWACAQGLSPMGPSSHSRLCLNKAMVRIISTVKCYFRLHYPKNWEFRTICQLATCGDHRPRTGLGLPPYTIITHSVIRRQSVEPATLIKIKAKPIGFDLSLATPVVSDYCLAVDSLKVGHVPPPAGEGLLCLEERGFGEREERKSLVFGSGGGELF